MIKAVVTILDFMPMTFAILEMTIIILESRPNAKMCLDLCPYVPSLWPNQNDGHAKFNTSACKNV